VLRAAQAFQADRVLEAVDGPFQKIEGFAGTPAGGVTGAGGLGFPLSHQMNDFGSAAPVRFWPRAG